VQYKEYTEIQLNIKYLIPKTIDYKYLYLCINLNRIYLKKKARGRSRDMDIQYSSIQLSVYVGGGRHSLLYFVIGFITVLVSMKTTRHRHYRMIPLPYQYHNPVWRRGKSGGGANHRQCDR